MDNFNDDSFFWEPSTPPELHQSHIPSSTTSDFLNYSENQGFNRSLPNYRNKSSLPDLDETMKKSLDEFIVDLLRVRKQSINPFNHFPGSIKFQDELEWDDPTIIFNGTVVWSRNELYCFCLDEVLQISAQLQKCYLESKDERLFRVLCFFNCQPIRNFIWKHLVKTILWQKSNHKSNEAIGHQVIKAMKHCVQDAISYGYYTNYIQEKDIHFFMNNLECFSAWKEVYLCEDNMRLEALKTHTSYRPWLVALKLSLEEVFQRERSFLEGNPEFYTQCVSAVVEWLHHSSKKKLIEWLLQFLFRESFYETKKKILYIQGSPNTGKSFFVDLLFHGSEILKKNMSMSYFSANKKGNYKLHALIFDDPGKAAGAKENSLAAEFFLNATKSDSDSVLNFPVKYGFMNVFSAQICLISNYGIEQMFPSQRISAMDTRITKLMFDNKEGGFFPLVTPTITTQPYLEDYPCVSVRLLNKQASSKKMNDIPSFEEESQIFRSPTRNFTRDNRDSEQAQAPISPFYDHNNLFTRNVLNQNLFGAENNLFQSINKSINFTRSPIFVNLFNGEEVSMGSNLIRSEKSVPKRREETSDIWSQDFFTDLGREDNWGFFNLEKSPFHQKEKQKGNVPKQSKPKKGPTVIPPDPRLNRDNMFYILWSAILKHVERSLYHQSDDTVSMYIPDTQLRFDIKNLPKKNSSLLNYLFEKSALELAQRVNSTKCHNKKK